MARREFDKFEAVSAVVPVEPGVYHAAIAVKALYEGGAPRFHKVLPEQTFKTASLADDAAAAHLENLQGVTEDAELVW